MENEIHVTRVSANGDVFGHTTDHCDEAGCSGDEHYFSVLRGSVEDGDGGCVAGAICVYRLLGHP